MAALHSWQLGSSQKVGPELPGLRRSVRLFDRNTEQEGNGRKKGDRAEEIQCEAVVPPHSPAATGEETGANCASKSTRLASACPGTNSTKTTAPRLKRARSDGRIAENRR